MLKFVVSVQLHVLSLAGRAPANVPMPQKISAQHVRHRCPLPLVDRGVNRLTVNPP